MITIKYVLQPAARKAVAKTTGALTMPQTRGLTEHQNFIPQKGDAMIWAAIAADVAFVVEDRVFRIDLDGHIQVDLHIEAYGPNVQPAT